MASGRCAACRSLRRKCPADCIFSPYFPSNDPKKFACVHKTFGGSYVGNMLQEIPPNLREQVVNTLYIEALCRIRDPVYGSTGIISKFYQEIHKNETELAKIQAAIAFCKLHTQHVEAESNVNIPSTVEGESNCDLLSTVEAESNMDILPADTSSMGQFQCGQSSKAR